MTPHCHWLNNYYSHCVPVELADSEEGGKCLVSTGIGTCLFTLIMKGKVSQPLAFTDVLHVPDLGSNLFSILTLTESKDFAANIAKGSIVFLKVGKTLLTTFVISLHLSTLTSPPHCLWIILYWGSGPSQVWQVQVRLSHRP